MTEKETQFISQFKNRDALLEALCLKAFDSKPVYEEQPPGFTARTYVDSSTRQESDSPEPITTEETWMSEARKMAGQCWCDEETQDREMDVVLAEAVAKRIATWMEITAQNQRNADYYRGLLERCGKAIGGAAYKRDDGSMSEDIICSKIPEIVEDRWEKIDDERLHHSDLPSFTPPPWLTTCSRCGSTDIYRRFYAQGEDINTRICGGPSSEFVDRSETWFHRVKKDCLVNTCRCCQYKWDSEPLT